LDHDPRRLPYESFLKLKAHELWQMGYRKCPDNGGADDDVVLGSPPGMPSRVMPDPEEGGSRAGMLDYSRAQPR
jgi:hypothetical protein